MRVSRGARLRGGSAGYVAQACPRRPRVWQARAYEPVRRSGPLDAGCDALDRQIVSAAVTNAALELLPESLASMAILPLQVRLVYQIGKAYGYELDQGHIKEFVATLGVGLTGQYLEQFGRKLLGGLLGTVLGGVGRAVGHQTASSGIAFATTWALGQLAKQYYGGGRTLDAAKLKAAFAPLLEHVRAWIARGRDSRSRAHYRCAHLPALIKPRTRWRSHVWTATMQSSNGRILLSHHLKTTFNSGTSLRRA